MQGIIGFDQFKVACIIGTNPEERIQEQEIYVDLKVEADFSRCAGSDNLHDTIDYRQLAEVCVQIAEHGKYQLIEKYAHDVLKKLMANFDISWAWIRIQKPQGLTASRCPYVELQLFR